MKSIGSCRLTTFVYDASASLIFAADDRGLVYRLSVGLQFLQRSASTAHGVAIHAIEKDDLHLYTRDSGGNVVRWCKERLEPLEFLVTDYMTEVRQAEEQATPAPSPSQALQIIDNKLLVSNSRGSLTVIDVASFAYEREIVATSGAFPERIKKGPDGRVWVTDVIGRVFAGKLEDNLFTAIQPHPHAVVHRLVFEAKSRRFWGTCDNSGSVFFLDEFGSNAGSLRITNDDVEDIAFSSDGAVAYVGCFDHYVHVIENQDVPEEVGLIGPFKFQINHISMLDDGHLLVMLESGELNLVRTEDGCVVAKVGGTTAAWSIHICNGTLHVGTEHGRIERFALQSKGRTLSLVDLPAMRVHAHGRIRRFVLTGELIIYAGNLGEIACCTSDGRVAWSIETQGIVRDLAVTQNGFAVVAVNEAGECLSIAAKSGIVLTRRKFNKPLWCLQAIDDERIAVGERSLSPDRGRMEHSLLHILESSSLLSIGTHEHQGNHKRIRLLGDGRLLITGNGSIKVRIVDPDGRHPVEEFTDWIINTAEAACWHRGRIYVLTYGYQLITFDCESHAAIDVQFVIEGYPTALEVYESSEHAFLIAGGRNFISTFLITDGGPVLVMTKYLSAHATSASSVSDLQTNRVRLRRDQPNPREILENWA
jgi:hypothetical protein